MLESCTVGLDIGTSNVKATAFDVNGGAVANAGKSLPLIHDSTGAAEQDPNIVYETANNVLAEVTHLAWQAGFCVERIGLSTAMHSLIAVSEDGSPLTNALLWMDSRAGKEASILWKSQCGKAIYKRTGTPIHAMSPLSKMLWMRQNQPHIFQVAWRFVSLKEWLWNRWFGEWCVDASIASATGLYNLLEGCWDSKALARAGIRIHQLSRIVPTTYTQSGVREPLLHQAGLTERTVFTIGASDGVLANLGIGALEPDRMVLNIGTSLAVRCGTREPVLDPVIQSFTYVLDRDRFVVGAPSNSGGILLEWFYRSVLGHDDSDSRGLEQMIVAAERVQTGSLICLPYLAGERAPLWDAEARAAFFGIGLEHTNLHLMRALIEGLMLNAYWIASGLFDKLGRPREIVCTGKLMETGWVRQLTADVFDLPIRSLGTIDASVFGAAILANIATGIWSWDHALELTTREQHTLTDPSGIHNAYSVKSRLFKQLAKTTLPHALTER
ncbi:MAG: gluconokinase [Ktedonobacterales bacterium]